MSGKSICGVVGTATASSLDGVKLVAGTDLTVHSYTTILYPSVINSFADFGVKKLQQMFDYLED